MVKNIYRLIKHKKKFRNYFLKEVYKLSGYEFINKSINKSDFYTCISLEDMNNDYIFIYDSNNKAFFFVYTSVYEKKNYEFETFRYFYNTKYSSFKNFRELIVYDGFGKLNYLEL